MDSEPGRSLIVWTVRLSVACYCYCVWRRVQRGQSSHDRIYSCVWGVSWLLCLIHVLCAYHFEHRWSQAAALRHTAELTQAVVGLYWSGGIYVNYLFLSIWAFDVCRCMLQQKPTGTGMHLVAAFMMFNATAVFGPRWWIVAAIAYLVVLFLAYRQQRKQTAVPPA